MKILVICAESRWYWKLFFWLWAKALGIPRLYGFATFWNVIVVRSEAIDNQRLLAHELTHVQQIKRLGILRFTLEYLKEQRRAGYRRNRFEVEARAAELAPQNTLREFSLSYRL